MWDSRAPGEIGSGVRQWGDHMPRATNPSSVRGLTPELAPQILLPAAAVSPPSPSIHAMTIAILRQPTTRARRPALAETQLGDTVKAVVDGLRVS